MREITLTARSSALLFTTALLCGCTTLPADRFDYHQLNTVTRAQVEAVHEACLQTAYHRSGQYIKIGLLTGGLNGLLAGTVIGQSVVRSHQLSCMADNGYWDYGK
ncbi:hypothetical protein EYC98_21295 [Halieaceae bacterium IMCC14734]|uniref:Lipoprotein n=1 Tax=Candidatus Litorirhabdus singularis TaxID=2518993 RepID=A0ABT3TM48_9GAMM|nr:hypothetical protein [Candidatus Litorirhabdus singularis]MCX2983403.1 hypothetical protein [Candidatus Litorirhabdus singularis]